MNNINSDDSELSDLSNLLNEPIMSEFSTTDEDAGWQTQKPQRRLRVPKIRTVEKNVACVSVTHRPHITSHADSTGSRVAPLAPLILAPTFDAPSITVKLGTSLMKTWPSCESRRRYNPQNTFRDINDVRDARRYHRLREVGSIDGFVVNIHDATNFDIDLQLPDDVKNKYNTVITNQYSYKDLGDEYMTNPSNIMTEAMVPEVGTTYRCRLRGVGVNQLPIDEHLRKSHVMNMTIKRLIDRADNWVSCTLSDIDVYQRLLVDINVDTSDGCVNVRDYLLEKTREQEAQGETPIFHPYIRERSAKSH
jgi:hypothetical protein